VNAVALMYHDVIPAGREDTSGFPGGDAARYKLTPQQFDDHLAAIRATAAPPAGAAVRGRPAAAGQPTPLFITFDDGGASAMTIADQLERFGCRGLFFMTAAYVGRPGFLRLGELRELRQRGHVVGSHSYSHPLRMARLPVARIDDEWRRSVEVLGDILGDPVVTASVPGGHQSLVVARMAAAAGIRFLFTSEPVVRTREVDGMRVIGRYVVRRSTSPRVVAAVAAGALTPRLKQLALWELKKVAKAVAGGAYLTMRERLLGRSGAVQWGDEPSWSKDTP
jgi:peptidoglycan/xylan/chitin deacetylase (PgdA/CDA1 family)